MRVCLNVRACNTYLVLLELHCIQCANSGLSFGSYSIALLLCEGFSLSPSPLVYEESVFEFGDFPVTALI